MEQKLKNVPEWKYKAVKRAHFEAVVWKIDAFFLFYFNVKMEK